VTTASRWVCKVCWNWNRAADEVCWRCKAPPHVPEAEIEAKRKAHAARAELPPIIPDAVVAVPVVVFRGYAKVWRRGGLGLVGFLLLMAFGGVTDVLWLSLTLGFAIGLFVGGLAAGEVAEGMRNREVWSYVAGIGLSVTGVIGSITAFSVFAPDLVNPNAVRWGSVLVFGGAGLAALAGLVMLLRNRMGR
jgi:hypothetical protein